MLCFSLTITWYVWYPVILHLTISHLPRNISTNKLCILIALIFFFKMRYSGLGNVPWKMRHRQVKFGRVTGAATSSLLGNMTNSLA